MSLACVVVGSQNPSLALVLDGSAGGGRTSATAVFVPNNEVSVRVLHFQYSVLVGDSTNRLEYRDIYALTMPFGSNLLRYSTLNPSIPANLLLPEPGFLGSLGYCCSLQIESSAPYIKSLVPLKRAGIYGENEILIIQARFSKPVTVVGVPVLQLKTGRSRIGLATYIPTESVNEFFVDLAIDLRTTDVLFSYVVSRYDNILSLSHTSTSAVLLSGGARILHLTNAPQLSADVQLREPGDFSLSQGAVDRQWKFRFPYNVELLLRDFFHTKPDSLVVNVEHMGKSAVVFRQCCKNQVVGNVYPKSRSGTNATLQFADTGVGSDFLFSDTQAPNIASLGSASQSSTRVAASKAIDRNVDPLIGNGAVSETDEEDDPWWQLALPASGAVVRSINIWARKPQSWIDPIVEFTIKGLDAYPVGFFKLKFSNINQYDPSETVTTDYLSFGMEAVDAKIIIENTPQIGNVLVSRRLLAPCLPDGGGCGVGVEQGKGYVYGLTFHSLRVAVPVVELVNVGFQGEQPHTFPAPPGEFIDYSQLPDNVLSYQIVTHVDVIRSGFYVEVPEIPIYGKGVVSPASTVLVGSNAWLTPFWVFLFPVGLANVPRGLNASIATASWSKRFESIDKLINIALNIPVATGIVKIQREGYGSLSLAEVELYEEKLDSLQTYDGGSPVSPSYLTKPYQPFEPFSANFNNLPFGGRWLVQLAQDDSLFHDRLGWSGAYGTISEAVLVVTDLAGIVHSYYQDLRAEIVSLPKFGTLSSTSYNKQIPAYGDWREAFEVAADGTLSVKTGFQRNLGYCYSRSDANDDFLDCADNFGVGPPLDDTMRGAVPEQKFLRQERVVIYTPFKGYLGPDVFTYKIHDGLRLQAHISALNGTQGEDNEVTLHVRQCRRFQSQLRYATASDTDIPASFFLQDSSDALATHALCACAASERGMLGDNVTACTTARTSLCNNSETRQRLLFMCLPCFDPLRGLLSGDCKAQTIRAVSLVTTRGLCDSQPPMDCSNEIITSPGLEKVSYLSLKPPLLYGAMSRSKNGFGGHGWFNTPLFA